MPNTLRYRRQFLYVTDLLTIYQHRKKSWAYKQLQLARSGGERGRALVADVARLHGWTELEMREFLGPSFTEKN
jgi:hypothetical protein